MSFYIETFVKQFVCVTILRKFDVDEIPALPFSTQAQIGVKTKLYRRAKKPIWMAKLWKADFFCTSHMSLTLINNFQSKKFSTKAMWLKDWPKRPKIVKICVWFEISLLELTKSDLRPTYKIWLWCEIFCFKIQNLTSFKL